MTLTTGTKAMVIVTGLVDPSGTNTGYLSFSVSNATTQSASDERAVISNSSSMQGSTTTVITNLTAGSNTFTLQYKGTASFENRTLTVIPLS